MDLKVVNCPSRKTAGPRTPAELERQRFVFFEQGRFPETVGDDFGGSLLAVEVELEPVCRAGAIVGPGDEVPEIGRASCRDRV